jgi:prepilin-type processing-associated H-X9-DG protein
VLAYEQVTNHNKKGMNVLYGDGSVNWIDPNKAQYLLSEKAGRNPPR